MKVLSRHVVAGIAVALIACPVAASAQDIADDNTANGRYSMTPAPNGFLRLDTRNGSVSLCTVKDNRVTCQLSADERGALEAEIARLAARNTELQKKFAEAGKSPGRALRDALPSDAEMDKALSFAEKFMRRMMRIMKDEDPPKDRI